MALNRSDKSRILRRYFPGMTRNSEMSTEPSRPPWFHQPKPRNPTSPARCANSRVIVIFRGK